MSGLDKTKMSFKSANEKINAFFKRQQWKEAMIFLAFVLLAFGFWYLQSLQQEYEIEISIPVRYRNAPPDITFTEELPDRVVVSVRDKGTVLLNYSFGRKFSPIEINLRDVQSSDTIFNVPRRDIESDILRQLLASTMLTGFNPSEINLRYSKRLDKQVPVVFDGEITTEAGFQQFGDIIYNPTAVTVFGGESQLDTIDQVKTVFTTLERIDKTLIRTLQLQAPNGTNIDPLMVTVTIPVEQFTEKSLVIPVISSDIPSDYIVRMFPPTVRVVSNIPLSRFNDLTEDLFEIDIPFADLEQNISGDIPIRLTQQPDWVNNPRLIPDRIEFILEQNRTQE